MCNRSQNNLPKRMGSENGAVLVFFALSLSVLIACLGLMVDGSNLINSRLEQEANAEYAALASLQEFINQRERWGGNFTTALNSAITKAEDSGSLNIYTGSNKERREVQPSSLASQESGSVKFGIWNEATGQFSETSNFFAINAVRVYLKTSSSNLMKTFFARIFKAKYAQVSSEAIAYYKDANEFLGRNPYLIMKK
jgi:Flp pilus assembly protein TadG